MSGRWIIDDRYILVRPLTGGEQENVHLASDRDDPDRPIVLERFGIADDAWALDAWRTRLILDHPHLAPILDFGRVRRVEARPVGSEPDLPPPAVGDLYFVTPFRGTTHLGEALPQVLASEPPDRARKWLAKVVAQVASALGHMHDRGLAHFDIKPEHIRIGGTIAEPHATLIDLGSSDLLARPLGNRVRGTLPFMAPEMLELSEIDARSDLFSLGATIYHAATDNVALGGESRDPADWPALEDLAPALGSNWMHWVSKLAAPNREERPSTIWAFLAGLLEAQPGARPSIAAMQPYAGHRVTAHERELEYLVRELERIDHRDSDRSAALVTGDPGSGRGAFLDRLTERARLTGFTSIRVHARPTLDGTWHSITAALAALRRLEPPESALATEIDRTVRWLSKGIAPDEPDWQPLEPASHELPRLRVRLASLFSAATRSPLFVAIEGLDEAPVDVVEAWAAIARQCARNPESRFFLVGSARDPLEREELKRFESESTTTLTRLRSLTLHAARDLARRVIGRGTIPLEVVARIHDRTAGMAGRFVEYFEEAVRRGWLAANPDPWSWTAAHPPDAERPAPAAPEGEVEQVAVEFLALALGPVPFHELASLCSRRTGRTETDVENELRESHVVRPVSGDRIGFVRAIDTTTNVDPETAELWIERCVSGRSEEVAAVIARARGMDAENLSMRAIRKLRVSAAFHSIVDLVRALRTVGEPSADVSLSEVEALRSIEQSASAIEPLEILIATVESDALRGRALLELARVHRDAKALSAARVALEKIPVASGSIDVVDVIGLQIEIDVESGELDRALERLATLRDENLPTEYSEEEVRGLSARASAEIERRRGKLTIAQEQFALAAELVPRADRASASLEAARVAYARGEYEGSMRWGKQALDEAQRVADPLVDASAQILLGRVAMNRGDATEAARRFRNCLEAMEILGHATGVASTLNNLGLVYKLEDDHGAAENCFRRSLAISEHVEASDLLVPALNNLSDVLVLRGSGKEALEHARRGLELRKEKNDQAGIAHSYYRLATIHRSRGELDAATDLARKSLEIRRELGAKLELGYSLKLVGQLEFVRGQYDVALSSIRQSLAHFESLRNRAGQANVLADLAHAFGVCGDLENAKAYAEQAIELSRTENLDLTEVDARAALGQIERLRENLSESERLYDEAERLVRTRGNRRRLTEILLSRAQLQDDLGQFERVEATLAEAYSAIDEHEFADLRPHYYLQRGRLLARQDPSLASTFLERGLEEAQRLDLPELCWRFLVELARIDRERNDPDLAKSRVHEASAIVETLRDRLPHQLSEFFSQHPERAAIGTEFEFEADPEPAPIGSPEAADRKDDAASNGDARLTTDLLRLQEIAVLLSTERDLGALLEAILDAVIELFGAERAFLIRLDSEDTGFEIAASRNVDREDVDEPEFKVSRSIALDVAKTGRVFLTDDARTDDRLRDAGSVHDLRLQAIACFPLQIARRRLGVIYIENRFRKRLIAPERVPLLEAFSSHAAVALANAELIAENVQKREELEKSREHIEKLNRKLEHRVETQSRELEFARGELERQRAELGEKYSWRNLVGDCESMRQLFRTISRVESTELPVLLEGESGTGKELVARALHFGSGERKRGPFVSENCGAVAESLFEAELFGHVRGAFTGADADREGLFAAAEGGTLFLDEIHTLSLGMQAKLLRVLEEGEYRPVGENAFRKANVRLISACNQALESLVEKGQFREDLFYRLNVIRISLPPLRDRGRDAILLAGHFLERYATQSEEAPKDLSSEATRWIVRQPWPGNVRELRNRIERAAVLSRGRTIEVEDLVEERMGSSASPASGFGLSPEVLEGTLRDARDRFQAVYVEHLLERNQGVVARAAREAGVTRESLHRLVKKLGLRKILTKARQDADFDES